FLPFVLLASALVLAAHRFAQHPRSVLAAAVILAALSLILHNREALPAPFAQWTFALPPFLLGLVMAQARSSGRVWAEPAFMVTVTGLAIAAGATEGLLQLLIAWPVLWVVWRMTLRGVWLAALGALSFGIYLIHPFFMLVLFKLSPALEATVPGVVLVFAASALTVAGLRRLPVLRRLV
ncbi:MAG: acyltransferase family protein, partial [Pararhodobacter sp.]